MTRWYTICVAHLKNLRRKDETGTIFRKSWSSILRECFNIRGSKCVFANVGNKATMLIFSLYSKMEEIRKHPNYIIMSVLYKIY